jgi:hypothetical protein
MEWEMGWDKRGGKGVWGIKRSFLGIKDIVPFVFRLSLSPSEFRIA